MCRHARNGVYISEFSFCAQANLLRQMIELGKRNLLAGVQLDMNLFAGNRSFCHVDFATLQDLYPR
jgi:hypothetical protein